MLRQMTRPGAYVDLKPDGVASSEVVRFDVLGGRVNHDPYMVRLQEIGRRYVTVELDTQPYGYWPTWINLAPSQFITSPGRISIKAASVIGDAPAYARLVVAPTTALIASGMASSYQVDFISWSLGGGPSLPGMLSGASMQGAVFGGYVTDTLASTLAGGATVTRFSIPPASAGFGISLNTVNGYWSLDNTARGRHRLYLWAQLNLAAGVQMSADVSGRSQAGPLASANPVATLVMTGSQGGATGLYSLYDLGEHQIPNPPEHGLAYPSYQANLRVFFARGSNAATALVYVAGAFLQPVDGPNGVIPYGLAQPSILGVGNGVNDLAIDSLARSVELKNTNFASRLDPDAIEFTQPGWPWHRGGLPYVGGTDTNLSIVSELRNSLTQLATWAALPGRGRHTTSGVTLQYRPRFSFLKGL
jgi:hypothetical protein